VKDRYIEMVILRAAAIDKSRCRNTGIHVRASDQHNWYTVNYIHARQIEVQGILISSEWLSSGT
jgi:hypothetical protein